MQGASSCLPSADNARMSLFNAAISGNEEMVRRFISRGADVNTTDEDGLTVLAGLVMGAKSLDDFNASTSSQTLRGRLAILSYLFRRNKFTLYSLNAPQIALRGLTPLCMAAYLDQPELVKRMLEDGQGRVIVDGLDAHQATPLMYAARDGNVDVVQCLTDNGAKPLLSENCRLSSIQFSLPHPRTLWILEKSLRLCRAQSLLAPRRKRKYKLSLHLEPSAYLKLANAYPRPSFVSSSPSRIQASVHPLINAVLTSDIDTVYKLLYPAAHSFTARSPTSTVLSPAALVNLPDSQGWSAIHYCVSLPLPSVRILDALFLAGADINLYTADHCASPLHCLARAPRDGNEQDSSFQLYSFIVHLVQDLGASLRTIDANGDTCLHVAAEDGQSLDVLMALLDCDTTGTVRKIQNARGLTAFDVARPEFRDAFGSRENFMRPSSIVSVRSLHRRASSASLTSLKSTTSITSSRGSVSTRGTVFRRDAMARLDRLAETRAIERMGKRFTNVSRALRRLVREEAHGSQSSEDDDTTVMGCSGSDANLPRLRPRDVPSIESVKANLFDASCASTEIFSTYRKLLTDVLDELRQCQGAIDSVEALGDHIDDVLRERDIASFPCVPDAGLRRPSLSSLGASSISSTATTLVGSTVSPPMSPSSSPKKGQGEFGSLAAVAEGYEWKEHELNGSIASRQRESGWSSWLSSIIQRKATMEQTNISQLIKAVENEKADILSRHSDDKASPMIIRGSKKGGLLRMGTRSRKDSKVRQAKARAAVEILDTWADLSEDGTFLDMMRTECDLVDSDPFRCDGVTKSGRVVEIKPRAQENPSSPSESSLPSTPILPVAPLFVRKKCLKRYARTFDLFDIARKELSGVDPQLVQVEDSVIQCQRMLADSEGRSDNFFSTKRNLLTLLDKPRSSIYSDITMTIMNHSPRSPLAIEMPLPRQLSPSCSTTSLRPPAQHSRTPSPALPDFMSGTTTPAPSLLDDDDNDDDTHSLLQSLQDVSVILINSVLALERITVSVSILQDVLCSVRKQHRL